MKITEKKVFEETKPIKTSSLRNSNQSTPGFRHLLDAAKGIEKEDYALAEVSINSFRDTKKKLTEENFEKIKRMSEEIEKTIIEKTGIEKSKFGTLDVEIVEK